MTDKKKIERVRGLCRSVLGWSDFRSKSELLPSWIVAQNRVANEILEILNEPSENPELLEGDRR